MCAREFIVYYRCSIRENVSVVVSLAGSVWFTIDSPIREFVRSGLNARISNWISGAVGQELTAANGNRSDILRGKREALRENHAIAGWLVNATVVVLFPQRGVIHPSGGGEIKRVKLMTYRAATLQLKLLI